uniref:Uncharacterized protein n=1 Tax=Arion vulgaris TaxID=1028688 RepID=A0A0B7BS29_9EUPU
MILELVAYSLRIYELLKWCQFETDVTSIKEVARISNQEIGVGVMIPELFGFRDQVVVSFVTSHIRLTSFGLI